MMFCYIFVVVGIWGFGLFVFEPKGLNKPLRGACKRDSFAGFLEGQ